MATFPSITPTYGQRKRSKPLTRTIRFADGYEHRLLLGLAQHQNPKEFSFTFEVSETDAEKVHLPNLFVKIGVNLYHITIELLFKQLSDKYLSQLHNDSKFINI